MNCKLFIKTNVLHGKPNIEDMYFTAPYKIMSPFLEGEQMEIMQMSASAGLFGGDTFSLDLQFGQGSKVTYSSQSYEKVFPRKDLQTKRELKINVEQNANVIYLPYPIIPFANSSFLGKNTIFVHPDSAFIYGDIFTCGRTGMGEYFQMKQYESRTKIYVGNELAFAERTWICPEKLSYQTMGMWGKYTHNGMLYLYDGDREEKEEWERWIEEIRKISKEKDCVTGVSKCPRGIVLRVLAMSGDKIYQMFQKIVAWNEK